MAPSSGTSTWKAVVAAHASGASSNGRNIVAIYQQEVLFEFD
jgi:hypothetical protein